MPYNEALIQYKVYRYRHMYLHLIREPFDRHLPEQNGICRYATRFFGEIPPCAHNVIFVTQFVLLIKTPPFYDVNSFKVENDPHMIYDIFLVFFSFFLFLNMSKTEN